MAYMSTNTGGGGGTPTKAEDADANTKIQVEESADENKIRFDTAGTERMIIDETGKVGLGVSTPTAPLHIRSNLGSDPTLMVESLDPDTATHGPTIAFNSNVTAAATPNFTATARPNSNNILTVVNSPSPISIGMYVIDGFGGALGINGTVTAVSGDPLAGTGTVTFSGTPAGLTSNSGPGFNMIFSVAPTNTDKIGEIDFNGTISSTPGAPGGTESVTTFASIGVTTPGADTTPDGTLSLNVVRGGVLEPRMTMSQDATMFNVNREDVDFSVNGNNQLYALHVNAGDNRVGIVTNSPVATLDVASGQTFRNTRLLTVAVSANTPLTEADHAGRYNICAGNVALPTTSTAGEHYAILNTTGGNITIFANTNNINGAASDFTLATYKAATCIAIGSNDWMVVG